MLCEGKLRLMTAMYIERDGKMLLLYRVGSRVVAPSWCGIGGHFEPDEISDARECVLRELEEETQIRREDLVNLRLKYITLRLKNGEVRHNYYFFASLREGVDPSLTCNEGALAWVDEADMDALNMPYTAKAVLLHYLHGGRGDDCLYGGIAKCASPSLAAIDASSGEEKNGVIFTPLEEF